MGDICRWSLKAVNEGTGVVTFDGGACVIIERSGRVIKVRS